MKLLTTTLVSFLLSALLANAQEVRATVTGLVSDPTGAAIVNAMVRVVNVSSQVTVTTKTNETGNYVTGFLAPGSYEMTVEASGFKRFLRKNIALQTQDKVRIDVQMEVGEMTQSVTVQEAVSTLETETASRGATISNQMIANLPTQGRNPFQIAWASPGVFKSGGWRYLRSFDIGGTTGFSANGGRASENEVLLDGITNVQSSRNVIHVPTMDSIQEFRILLNTYDAQYGRTGGGIVTIVTKGGSNDLHGTAYEFFQNDKMNANQFELNAARTKRPPNNINAFGFQVSGPVWIPKVYNGRNRLFWMVAYEGMRQRSADPAVLTVPEMDWRKGDFSGLRNAAGAVVTIYDPLTTAVDGARTPFSGNILPSSRLSKMATEAFQYYPAPTSVGVGPNHVQNYPFPSRWVGDLDQWIGRMDLNVNSKNNVYFRYGQNPYSEYRGLTFIQNPSDVNPAEPTGNAPLIRNGRNWMADWTSVLTPTITLDLRAGLSRWEETTGSSYGTGYDQRKMGVAESLLSQFTRQGFPNINLGAYKYMGTDRLLNYSANDVYTLQPNVNMVKGKHVLKMGMEVRRYNDNALNPGLAAGSYKFEKNWSQANANRADAVSGNEVATFLLGYPTSAYVDRNIDPAWVHYFYAGFIQDDWKVTPRLTLNLGLRWDYESPATERYDRMVRTVDYEAASPIASQVQGLTLKGAVRFANYEGQPGTAFEPDRKNWAPRVGAAYRLGDKWVLRGGYGLYYLGQHGLGPNTGFSQRTEAIVTTDNLKPAVTTANAFALMPGGLLLPAVGTSQGAGSFLGQSVTGNYLNRPLPYSHQYSFDIQRELKGGILVEAGYVGNQTRKLPLTPNANYVPISELGRRTSTGAIDTAYYTGQVPNPMAGKIPNNAALNGATTSRQNLLYAFPQFAPLNIGNVPIGSQRYDSFQLKVTKRFAKGLTILSSYTIAKTLEQVALQNPQFFNLSDVSSTQLIKQPADQIDIPQKFNFIGVYELPFGNGRQFGGNVNRWVDGFIGGWGLDWNVTYMKGWCVAYPNASQVVPGSAKIDNPSIPMWFNTSMWNDATTGKRVAAQEPYTLKTFPLRFSDVRLPGYQNWDVSMSKTFPIHERLKLQFRFEAVNAFNRPWFTAIASVDVTNAAFGQLNASQNNLPRFLKLGLNLRW